MWPHIGLRRARRANTEGQQALASGHLDVAERGFTAALKQVGDKAVRRPSPDSPATEIAAAASLGLGRVCLARDDLRAADLRFGQVQRLRPARADGFYWAGCTAAHAADFARAEWFFGAALERDAGLGRAYLQRAQVRARLGREDLALTDLAAADRCGALDGRARLLTAALLLRHRQWAAAESFAAAAGAEQPVAAAIRGIAAHEQGRVAAAFEAYQHAIAGGCRPDVVLLRHGLAGYQLRRFTASVDSWTALRDRHPRRDALVRLAATAHHARAEQRAARSDFAGAIEDVQAARSAVPSGELDAAIPELNLHAAARALASGDRERARAHLVASGDPRASRYLGLLSLLDRESADAERHWRAVLDRTPSDPQARLGLALCALHQGRPDEAALAELSGPDVPDRVRRPAAHALAAWHVRQHRWSAAVDALAAIPEDDPWRAQVLPECLYRSGRDAELHGLPDNPWQALARVRAGAPDDDTAAAAGDQRVRRERDLLLRDGALAAAARAEWDQAASLLHRAAAAGRDSPEPSEALLYGMGGHRSEAIEWLAAAARRAPADARVGHALALMLLHTLSAPDLAPPPAASWSTCIAVWTSVLCHETFWEEWRQRAQRRYDRSVTPAMVESLRTRLRDLVEHRASAAGVDEAPFILRREQDAARLLGELGGLPLPSNGDRLVCGPVRIAELGLHREFGWFVVALRDAECFEDLLRQFSRVGLAEARLATGRAAEALTLAMDLRCGSCGAGAARPDRAKPPLVCAADCPEFDRHNPAYAGLADKHEELRARGTEVVTEALLDLARAAITRAETDIAEAARCWREAAGHGARLGVRAEVLRIVVDTAVGRAEALSRKKNWTGAIDVLDAARTVVGSGAPAEAERLIAQLASLLTTRGIDAVNKDRGNARAAHADLTRALRLAPQLIRARRNLGLLLRIMAHDRLEARDFLEAVQLLSESVQQFDRALADKPGHPELREERETAWSELQALVRALGGR
ncbi:tetratricopeptide repeat protein [Gandjariella thermophila]|uniref:Uncharacterized protein n=1 Tax=Gandjariella thermophila TaxID=1931992 RepID=A0A4D4J5Z6_9PSEU|nr:tetratricopeptide repeat protein [Gandjariella thermophila]GDY31981.1 hypothetical protein GTS_36140 [Gandjariella thermophila]